MSCETVYHVGDVVHLRATFTDAAGAAVSPTTVVFKVKRGTGGYVTNVSGTQTGPTTGIYKADFEPDAAGTYYVRAEGTGTVKAAEESSFVVSASRF